jgi:predicted RNase H-like nuclease (RuvC/YqgF family)
VKTGGTVRAELERQLATPGAHVEEMEAQLHKLEAEKARLIRLAATIDDDPDIALEVNKRRQQIGQLQAQLAGARQSPKALKEALDRATEHVGQRFADLRALLADRGEGGRRLYQALFPDGCTSRRRRSRAGASGTSRATPTWNLFAM